MYKSNRVVSAGNGTIGSISSPFNARPQETQYSKQDRYWTEPQAEYFMIGSHKSAIEMSHSKVIKTTNEFYQKESYDPY